MPCLLILLALLLPRVTLVLMWLAGYTATTFQTVLWPLLGFFLAPYTTCAYVIAMQAAGGFEGWGLILLIIGVLFDLSSHGGGAYSSRRRN